MSKVQGSPKVPTNAEAIEYASQQGTTEQVITQEVITTSNHEVAPSLEQQTSGEPIVEASKDDVISSTSMDQTPVIATSDHEVVLPVEQQATVEPIVQVSGEDQILMIATADHEDVPLEQQTSAEPVVEGAKDEETAPTADQTPEADGELSRQEAGELSRQIEIVTSSEHQPRQLPVHEEACDQSGPHIGEASTPENTLTTAFTGALASTSKKSKKGNNDVAGTSAPTRKTKTKRISLIVESSAGGHQCVICRRGFQSDKALHGHLRSHPELTRRGTNPTEREVADALIRLKNSFEGTDTPSEEIAQPFGTQYKCSGCGKVFFTRQGLGGHRATHRGTRGCYALEKTVGEEDGSRGMNEHTQEQDEVTAPTSTAGGLDLNMPPPEAVLDLNLPALPDSEDEYSLSSSDAGDFNLPALEALPLSSSAMLDLNASAPPESGDESSSTTSPESGDATASPTAAADNPTAGN